jgi:type I restriction enzyme S subunit
MSKTISLRQLIRIHYGKALKAEQREANGNWSVYGSNGQVGIHTEALTEDATIIIGRKGSVGEITYAPNGGWTIDTAFYVEVLDKSKLDLRYLYYSLKKLDLQRHTITTSIPGISRELIYDSCIPLPPLLKQRHIAAILDKADAICGKREKAIELTDSFLRSVFLEMFGDPVVNPKSWEVVPLKELTTKIGSGATPRGGEASYKSSGITLIRSMNVRHLSFEKKGLVFLDDQQADGLSNVEVGAKDVLLNITGASVCRCCLVDPTVLPARVNQHVAIIRTKEKSIDPTYLVHLVNSPNYQRLLLNKARGAGATREALTKGQIEELLVPVPPTSLQEKFRLICLKAHQVLQNQDSSLAAVESLSHSLQNSLFHHQFAASSAKFVAEQEVAHAL